MSIKAKLSLQLSKLDIIDIKNSVSVFSNTVVNVSYVHENIPSQNKGLQI